MKKQKLTRLLSLFLTVALLTGVLLVTSAAAEVVVPPKKDAGSILGHSDTDASLFDDLGQVMADASGDKKLGVFQIEAANSENVYLFSAFYFTDGSNSYIVADSLLDEAIQDGYDSLTLVGLKGKITASYLGKDKYFTYIKADGLDGYAPLKMASSPADEVTCLYVNANDSGTLELYGFDMDLKKCKTEDNIMFLSDKDTNSNLYDGMPVVSKDQELVGETFRNEDKLVLFRFVGSSFKFPSEYALSASGGFTDKTTLYLIIGVAVVAAFLFWQKKGKKQPQQQAAQGSIPLDSGSVNAGAGFDKTSPLDSGSVNAGTGFDKTRNQTDSAADGQDIYGPTVPNPSEAPRHTAPLQERETVPVAQWQVRCVKGPLSGRVYPLSASLTFGRGARCDVKFPQDAPGISTMHCQVSVKGDKVYLQDLGSSYGTYYPQNNLLNSKTEYPLHSGEVFTLAQDGAAFRLEKMGAAAETGGFTIKDVNGKTYRSDASMRMTLGRNPGCQGGFDGTDSSISGRHCVLYREDGKLYLMDLASTNGTFFSQQERLKANVPYRIRKGMAFFLTTPKNTFVVVEE